MNAKLRENDFQHKTFRRTSLHFLLLILVVVAAYNYFFGTFFGKSKFPINTIQVVGDIENLKQQTLQAAMVGYLDAGFFTVDVAAIKKAVETLEWIESASVRRVWPDKIRVLVTEQKAIAQWDNGALINRNGMLFSPEKMSYPEQLVRFNGPEAMRIELLELYQELQPMLKKQALDMTKVELDGRRALEISLSNGIRFILGRQRNVGESGLLIERFLIACKQGLAGKLDNIAIVDFRYTNGFSVRWKDKEQKNAKADSNSISMFGARDKASQRVSVSG